MSELCHDLNQLVSRLDANPKVRHWKMQCVNEGGSRKGYEMTIVGKGVSGRVRGRSVPHLFQRALAKIGAGDAPAISSRGTTKTQAPKLKLV